MPGRLVRMTYFTLLAPLFRLRAFRLPSISLTLGYYLQRNARFGAVALGRFLLQLRTPSAAIKPLAAFTY